MMFSSSGLAHRLAGASRALCAAILGALFVGAPAGAVEVTLSFEASLVGGTCGLDCIGLLGGSLSGTLVYESTAAGSGTNPRTYPATSFDFTTAFGVEGGATSPTVSIANNVSSPVKDGFTVGGFGPYGSASTLTLTQLSLQMLDDEATVFSNTDLPGGAPSLSAFESALITMTWSEGAVATWAPVWEITSMTSGLVPGGDCCVAHAATSCDEAICASSVCAADSFCCDNSWDSVCADRAADTCAVCGGGSASGVCPVVGTGPHAALNDQIPTEPPFNGTAIGSSDTARGWRFTANDPDLLIDRLGALTAVSDFVPHTVTLFDYATQVVLAQATTSAGAGWRWVGIDPVPLVQGSDYVVTVHSTIASWLWSGARIDIGEHWFPTDPLSFVQSRLAISADPSAFPTYLVADAQQGIADVGYVHSSCFEVDGGGLGSIVDSTSGPPGQSIELRVDAAGLIRDLDVSIRLAESGGAPGSETWWDDLKMTLSKNGQTYPLNANPTQSVNGLFDVVFDAEAASSIAAAKAGGDAVGSYRPDGGVFEPFDGQLLAGVWTLNFEEISTNTGETVIEEWSLTGRVVDEPALVECDVPHPNNGGDTAGLRGLRFSVDEDFQGVRISMQGNVAGIYSFTASLRRSSGFTVAPEVVVPLEASLITSAGWSSVPIDFGVVEVSGSETFTLALTGFSGPGTAYFEVLGGTAPCAGVEETEFNTSSTPSVRGDPNHFSVIAVPEPALWLGLVSGVAFLGLLGRTRRR